MKKWLINLNLKTWLYLIVSLPIVVHADTPMVNYFSTIRINILAFATDNNFLLQCIITLLLVMIFGYAGKLLYERRINKE